jgi:hypothetical protein
MIIPDNDLRTRWLPKRNYQGQPHNRYQALVGTHDDTL